MENLDELIALLGRPANDTQVSALLSRLGMPARPKIPRGESGVYLNAHAHGLSLLFKDSDDFASVHGVSLSSDLPVLGAIFLYGPGDDEFKPFLGGLKGLRYDMGQAEVQHVLGPHALWDPDFNTEAWDILDRVRLFVDYRDDSRDAVSVVQVTFHTP